MDEAIARLSAQLRSASQGAQPDKKFRFDFRTHRPTNKPTESAESLEQMAGDSLADLPALDSAVAGMEALQSAIDRRWADDVAPSEAEPVPAPGATADAQLEAIRQRLAELSGGRATELPVRSEKLQRSSTVPMQPAEPPQSRAAFSLSVVENHLARLAGEVAMLGQRRAPADPELLSRISELRDLVAANDAGVAMDRLVQQLSAIAQRVEAIAAAMPRQDSIADVSRRVDAVAAQVEQLGAEQDRPVPGVENLAREIALLRREFAATVRRPDTGLEAQIAALAGRIDAIGQNSGGPSLAKLEAQIAAMAARFDQSGAAATQAHAAERRQERPAPIAPTPPPPTVAQPTPDGAENLLIMALREDLLRLQAGRAAAASAAAQPASRSVPRRVDRPFEEADRQRHPPEIQETPRRQTEPVIEDHRPLEPGSGRPTYRAASAGKSEFVAAARRAAVAAAAESEIAQPVTRQRRPAPAGGGGVANLFRDRRGAAMLAAGIVAIGLAAVPMLLFNGERDSAAVVQRDSTSSPADEAVVALEDLPVAKADATPSQPRPAAGGGNMPLALDTGPSANHFSILDPSSPAASKDSSRPEAISPDLTAATPPLPGSADFSPPAGLNQSAPVPPEAIGPERLRNAAASGDPNALFEIASRYAEGRGVPANATEAATWYKLAAERGLAIAQFRIASLYERGEGVEQSRMAAAEWYRRAAEQGNVRAMHNLAVMLSEGIGGPPDFKEASRWFIAGADHGVRDSQYNLGVMFARGLGGEQDLVQSYKWFAIAAQQGDPDAGTRRDEVAKVLSPDQLAQAQASVRAWRATEPPAAANVPPVADDSWNATRGPVSALDQQGLVRLIQEKLTERGFDPGPADGQPGPKTRDAVIAFQRERGVQSTGEIGPDLIAALDLPAP